jgi:glycosyltransferase involved in cell wall biosynthesis
MPTLLFDLSPMYSPARFRGPGRYTQELALGLGELRKKDLGDLRILGLTWLGLDGAYQVTDDLTAGATVSEATPFFRYAHWKWARRWSMWNAAKKTGAHAMHLADPYATPLAMGLTDTQYIVTCHDLIPALYRDPSLNVLDGDPRINFVTQWRRFHSADHVVAISEATKSDLLKHLKMKPEKISRVYNGVDVEGWSKAPTRDRETVLAKHGLAGRSFVLYVGGYSVHKNIEGMFHGYAKARAQGLTADFVWAGRVMPEKMRIVDRIAKEAGITDHLRFLGYVDDGDLSVLYRAALAHILPSFIEGFGLTVVEAMAAGCPVVTTHEGSLSEVAGDAALTVAPRDHAAIGHALARVQKEPRLRESLIEKGRKRAPSFGRAVQAHEIVKVYRKVIDTARHR